MDRLTRNIARINNELQIKVSISPSKNGSYFTESVRGNNKYISVDMYSSFILERILQQGESWSKENSALINTVGQSKIVYAMRRLYNKIVNTDLIFRTVRAKDGRIRIGIDNEKAREYSEYVFNIGPTGNSVRFIPAVLFDEDERTYEGVIIAINSNANTVHLSIGEFETLLFTLENHNLTVLSQVLLNTLIEMDKQVPVQKNTGGFYNQGQQRQQPSGVQSRGFTRVDVGEFFGIGGGSSKNDGE